jgi:alginate export protein
VRTGHVGLSCAALLCGAAIQAAPSAAQVASAQVSPPGGPVQVTGSLRLRAEGWDWFAPSVSVSDNYAFGAALLRTSAGMTQPGYDWQVELAVPLLLGLPDDAVAPAPQGQLGFGAAYRTEARERKVGLVPKQAFLRLKLGRGATAPKLRLGRFEFNDGQETQPRDGTIAWLKRERVAQRLIGSFGFSHVGRSFDGLQLKRATPRTDITLLAVRPTPGVFQLNGLGELDIGIVYAALTRALLGAEDSASECAEGRLFAIYYTDRRAIAKTDNRSAAVRSGDLAAIAMATVGGHYLHARRLGPGTADLLLWGALQFGDWGVQRQRAHAYAGEVGYRIDLPTSPWLRLGYFRGSGDATPDDATHGTFFQLIPTPRPYARMPFYNLMNSQDVFMQVVLAPTPALTVRADAHDLRLTSRQDLWYTGGGAFDQTSFGFAGRPSNGGGPLARLLDVSVDYQLSTQLAVTVYAGRAIGRNVVRSIYPDGAGGAYGYVEVAQRF